MGEQSPQQKADVEMITAAARGDHSAFAALYDRLGSPLYSLAYRMLGDAAEVQDAMQDVFLEIWRRAANYDAGQSSVFTWAVLLTRSRVIDRLRARGRRSHLLEVSRQENEVLFPGVASTSGSGADIVSINEEAARVRSLVGELPVEQRQAVELAFFSALTHQEIAEQLRQPLGTIKARIRRGLMKLREQIR